MPSTDQLAFFIASIVLASLGWWFSRLYGQFDSLKSELEESQIRLSVVEARLDSLNGTLEKMDKKLDDIYARLLSGKAPIDS